MSRMSKYNVFYNIDDSNITYTINNLTFYFSSESLKNSFIRKLENLDIDKRYFENRYNCKLENLDIFLISYYKRAEKRGYKIIKNEKLVTDFSLKIKA